MISCRITCELFRRHVSGSADRHPRSRNPRRRHCCVERFRDTEISYESMCALSENICWLDVAMNHTARMRIRECIDDVVQHAHNFLHTQPAFLESVTKRLAVDIRHSI